MGQERFGQKSSVGTVLSIVVPLVVVLAVVVAVVVVRRRKMREKEERTGEVRRADVVEP